MQAFPTVCVFQCTSAIMQGESTADCCTGPPPLASLPCCVACVTLSGPMASTALWPTVGLVCFATWPAIGATTLSLMNPITAVRGIVTAVCDSSPLAKLSGILIWKCWPCCCCEKELFRSPSSVQMHPLLLNDTSQIRSAAESCRSHATIYHATSF